MLRLGIIGGMGPAATARLFSRIVDLTDASRDQDHIEVSVLNRPGIPDRTAFLLDKPDSADFVPVIQNLSLELEASGCAILAMPCNTAHTRLGEISSVLSSARFVDMLGETAALVASLGCSRVGILATDGTLSTGAYQNAVEQKGLEAVVPDEDVQKTVMSIIYDDVKAGFPVPASKIDAVLDHLIDQKCDGIVLGCTELSVIDLPLLYSSAFVVDSLDVLAWRCVQECGAKSRTLPVLSC